MGHFRVTLYVGHRAGERFAPIEALVDTGATYTWIPRDVLERLGVVRDEEWPNRSSVCSRSRDSGWLPIPESSAGVRPRLA
jgi:hypothetical protein